MTKLFCATNTQKVLDFLINHPGEEFLASQIQRALKLSKGGVNISLRELAVNKLVRRQKKGKVFLYAVAHSQPVIKQLKVLRNIELLSALIARLSPGANKIILFGSAARGENLPQSDIDIFILANDPKEIERLIGKGQPQKKLQLIIRAPVAFARMQKNEPVFFEEINRGITLWEARE